MKLIETNSKYRGINGKTGKDYEGSISGRYDPYHLSHSTEINEMSSKNLIEYILHEKSALMLSNPFSYDSSLNIKVSGGAKKTTPPTPKKEKPQKVNGRSKRRRSQSSHDDKDYEMNESSKGVGNDSHSGSGQKNNQHSEGSGGEKWGRGKSSKNEEKKNHRKKYYDNTYSSNKSNQSFGKGISNSDISDELEIPVGQWIAILCALIGIAYHHFNLGKKIPQLLKSKNKSITQKKLTTGKKGSSGSKKGKKRGNNSNTSKGRRGKPLTSKILNEPVDNKEHSLKISQLSETELSQSSKLATNDPDLNSPSIEKKLESNKFPKDEKKEESIEKKVIHVQKSLDENPAILNKVMEKTKTTKKKKKKTKLKPRLESNTPDGVSTDGSSSTEEADTGYDDDQIMPLAELGFNEEDADDEGEWTVVGASSSSGLSSRVSNVDNSVSCTKESKSIPDSNRENDQSKAVDKLEVETEPVKEESSSGSGIDIISDDNKASDDSTASQQLSSTTNAKDVDKVEEPQETNADHIESLPPVNSEEDDAAYARMLQKQEEEMVAANEKKSEKYEDQGWEEVKKKKRNKKTQDAA